MPKKIQLHIADPCHENWNDMSEVEKGRFCGSCRKQVIDFSEMSDREIVQFFKQPSKGSVCGRFMSDQLDRDMVMEKKRLPWIKYFFQFALPAFLLGKQAQAQTGDDRKPATVQTPREYVRMGIMVRLDKVQPVKRKLHIQVKDETTGKSIPYASIMVGGDNEKKIASKRGIVSADIVTKGKTILLTVSSVGYKTKTYTHVFGEDAEIKLKEVELEIDPIVMDDVVVVNTKPVPPPASRPYIL
ncbi:MAG TPA: hypothetical protein VHM26_09470, partial [Chitinophagaceae bacterium]|nr:hypothetical protein [Chitinophagaceae bacterium]